MIPYYGSGPPYGRKEELGFDPVKKEVKPPTELPNLYLEDRLVLLPRDPYWAFAYWEISEQKKQEIAELFGDSFRKARRVLRISELAGGKETFYMEIDVKDADNWYVPLWKPGRSFVGELGFLIEGRFVFVARSNEIRMPRADMAASEPEIRFQVPPDQLERMLTYFSQKKPEKEIPIEETPTAVKAKLLEHLGLQHQSEMQRIRDDMTPEAWLTSPGLYKKSPEEGKGAITSPGFYKKNPLGPPPTVV
ncbi:MAG: DUF4912 domain-containing protein [Armatimonadetes bacterium]|nr:DUF4912 domain-containing protein [Armatimonadota bacterium]